MTTNNIDDKQYNNVMGTWKILLLPEFEDWFNRQSSDLNEDTVFHLSLLEKYGPNLKRPYVDTLKGSKIPNLKELRFSHEGAPIRILFVFDPKRQAVIILGGDKSKDKRWYEKNIPHAEKLYKEYLEEQ